MTVIPTTGIARGSDGRGGRGRRRWRGLKFVGCTCAQEAKIRVHEMHVVHHNAGSSVRKRKG